MSNKAPYDLTERAVKDLESIYDYTLERFSAAQAISYLKELKEVMITLSDNTSLGKQRNEVRKGLRSFPKKSHVIYYRIVEKRVRIIRVLHGSKDIQQANFFG